MRKVNTSGWHAKDVVPYTDTNGDLCFKGKIYRGDFRAFGFRETICCGTKDLEVASAYMFQQFLQELDTLSDFKWVDTNGLNIVPASEKIDWVIDELTLDLVYAAKQAELGKSNYIVFRLREDDRYTFRTCSVVSTVSDTLETLTMRFGVTLDHIYLPNGTVMKVKQSNGRQPVQPIATL